MIHTPGSLAHMLKSSQKKTLGTHSGHTHIYPCRCRYPVTNQDTVTWICITGGMKTDIWISSLLTPLLSRQVWLLFGHSQASPSQPSVQTHFSITQEPRSDKRGNTNIKIWLKNWKTEEKIWLHVLLSFSLTRPELKNICTFFFTYNFWLIIIFSFFS